MRRRTVLLGMATVTGGLAGCLQAQGDPDDNTTEDDPESDVPASSGPESGGGGTDDPEPTLESRNIETTGSGCSDGDHGDASVNVGDSSITVEGTIQASDPCHEAILQDVALEDRTLSLTVDVEATGAMCTECVGEIDYEATFEIENVDGVESANVDHVGGPSMAMGWDSASESAAPPDEEES